MKRRGWNVSNKNLAEIIDFINSFEADTKEKKRDLAILRYAFIDGMSAMQIAELNDDIIVCFGNRAKGKPLSSTSISRIIKSYDLIHEKRQTKKANAKRLEYANIRRKIDYSELKCAKCGSKENIEIHHMIPLAMGGTNDEINLIPLCHSCHKKIHAYITQTVID